MGKAFLVDCLNHSCSIDAHAEESFNTEPLGVQQVATQAERDRELYKVMGGSVRSDGLAPPVPADVRQIIQTIREISGNHSDQEIYALLKESHMDPDQTAQKLLSQDTFHEVKRKRDKKKENVGNRDSGEGQSKFGNQGRVGRTGAFLDQGCGQGGYLPYYNSDDAGAGRGFRMARNNRISQSTNRSSNSAGPPSTAPQNKPIVAYASERSSLLEPVSLSHVLPNRSLAYVRSSQASKGSWRAITVQTTMPDKKSTYPPWLPNQIRSAPSSSLSAMLQGKPVPNSQQYITLTPTNSVSGAYSSSSDPVPVPSCEPQVTGVVGASKREVGRVGSQQPLSEHSALPHSVESSSFAGNLSEALQLTQSSTQDASVLTLKLSVNDKSASTIIRSGSHDRSLSRSVRLHGGHVSESRLQASTYSVSRSFMGNHYNSRSPQQTIGHQKAGPNMEWKPKPTNQNSSVSPALVATSPLSIRASEVNMPSMLPSGSANLEIAATRLHGKLEELNIRDDRHVIIPNHLQVPEADRTGLSFGSFGAGFGTNFSSIFGNNDSDKSRTVSEVSDEAKESNEEPPSSISNTAPFAPNEDYLHHQETSTSAIEKLPGSNNVTGSIAPAARSQSEALKPQPVRSSSWYSLVQTAPNYTSIGLVPQIIRSQYPSHEQVELQQQDVSRLPNFVHTYDPSTRYCSPFFRAGSDGDARFPTLIGCSPASNYNGIVTFLSGRNVSLSQETGNSMVLSTAGATAQLSQIAGTPQITLPLQQPLPMFGQPPSVHISHLPPNYLPYPQYLSPLYVPPPTIHGFANNPGYPQLPTGSNYPVPAASLFPPAAAALKYSFSQYKPSIASGNVTHRGGPVGYGSYTTAPGYAVSPAVSGGGASGFDDIVVPQYKEHDLYSPSQQVEGSAIWIQASHRDPSGMQSSSYYNPQAQGHHATYAPSQSGHVSYVPSQSGHAAYAGLYHPTQSGLTTNVQHVLQQSQTLGGAVGVANAQAGAYQQSQHGRLNWTDNY